MTTTPFIFKERYVTVEADMPGYEGLTIEARLNLANGERIALVDDLKDIDAALEERTAEHNETVAALLATQPKASDEDSTLEEVEERTAEIKELSAQLEAINKQYFTDAKEIIYRRRALVAPYIRSWNLAFEMDGDGVPIPIASPQEQGVAAFEEINDDEITNFCLRTLLNAYQSGKGLGGTTKSAVPQAPTSEQSSGGPKVKSSSSSQAYQKK